MSPKWSPVAYFNENIEATVTTLELTHSPSSSAFQFKGGTKQAALFSQL